jgi:hypothetical protein
MRALPALLAVALLALAPPALGADKTDPKFAARALADHGAALYEAGKYKEAIDVFTEADRLFHAPTLVLMRARAHAALGQLVQARAVYQSIVDEQLAEGAPAAFVDAQRTARAELEAIDRRIPALRVTLHGGDGRGVKVSVDDVEVQGYGPDRWFPLDPGTHRVTVVPFGGVGVSRSVELAEGARASVDVELPVAPVAAPPPPLPPPPPPGRPWFVPAMMGFGLGVVGLAVGTGTGVVAMNDGADLRRRCGGSVCRASAPGFAQEKSDIAAAQGMATASTVGFVVAGVGAAVGVVLLVVKPGSRPAPASAAIVVGPGTLGVLGVIR